MTDSRDIGVLRPARQGAIQARRRCVTEAGNVQENIVNIQPCKREINSLDKACANAFIRETSESICTALSNPLPNICDIRHCRDTIHCSTTACTSSVYQARQAILPTVKSFHVNGPKVTGSSANHATRESGIRAMQSGAMRFANHLTETLQADRIDRFHRFTIAETPNSEGGFCRKFVTGRHTPRPRRSVGNRCGRYRPRTAASIYFLGR